MRSIGSRVCLLVLLSMSLMLVSAWGEEVVSPADTTGSQGVPGTGALQRIDDQGRPTAPFPLQHTEMHVEISGGIASVVVEQVFNNPFDRGIEAVYVFPLPHTAAVDDLELRIGERIVRGEIRTREAARQAYEAAKQEGRMAALLDQERPNIFTQRVANIQPGHEIRVRIRYFDMLEYQKGTYELVIPTVVGPRFIPGSPLHPAAIVPASVESDDGGVEPELAGSGTGWSPDTDRVPDASRITPPVLPPGKRSGHDLGITVDLDAGVPLQRVSCPSHAVDAQRPGPSRARVQLRASDTIPNKDFVLRYQVAGKSPAFGLLAHRDPNSNDGFGYFSLVLQPEAQVTRHEIRPKEMIFILDTSGSMRGEPIGRSKTAMRWAVQHLDRDDTFTIIRFSDTASSFSPQAVRATRDNVQRALAYIEELEGSGGTQMLSGILAALDLAPDDRRIRIVCMLTDGYIGNELEILAAVRQRIGEARLFTFGIGSSVNRYLLDEMAEEGRGTVDYIPLDGDTQPLVERFYDRVSQPYLTDIAIDWGELDVQGVYPGRMPDLFAGQPLVVTGRYGKSGSDDVVVRGRLGRNAFEHRLQVALPDSQPDRGAIGTLWARRRIDTLMQRMHRDVDSTLVRAVTNVALEFHLVTRFTSFVAVDNQIVSEDGKPMLVPQPVEMPLGVSYEGVFGKNGESRSIRRVGFAPGSNAVRVVGKPKEVDVRSSEVQHVQTDKEILSLPAESVSEAVALNTGVVVHGGELHVRGGRSSEVSRRIAGVPPAASLPPESPETAWRKFQSLEAILQSELTQVLAGDRVRITITIRNTGNESVLVPNYLLPQSLGLRITRDGREIRPQSDPSSMPLPGVALEPGATRVYHIVLDRSIADFAVPGRYEIALTKIGGSPLREPHSQCALTVQ